MEGVQVSTLGTDEPLTRTSLLQGGSLQLGRRLGYHFHPGICNGNLTP